MTRIFEGLEDLRGHGPGMLGASDWHRVDQQQIDRFAEVTGDEQWIHVDRVRAADGPFGTTVAHGLLALSILPALAAEAYRIDGVASRINYGYDSVRFPAPLPAGSRVRDVVELLDITDGKAGSKLHLRHVLEIDGGAKPACVADAITLIPLEGAR